VLPCPLASQLVSAAVASRRGVAVRIRDDIVGAPFGDRFGKIERAAAWRNDWWMVDVSPFMLKRVIYFPLPAAAGCHIGVLNTARVLSPLVAVMRIGATARARPSQNQLACSR
jgi:hypothetical protein